MPRTAVSFILVNFHDENMTRRAIASILDDNKARSIEIVVVDNESDPGSWEAQLPAHTQLIRHAHNLGFAGGILSALPVCSSAYVAVINNDATLLPGWTTAALSILEGDREIGVVGGPDVAGGSTHAAPLIDAATAITRPETRQLPELAVPYITGSNFLARAELMPLWDPGYFLYYEDVDFFASVQQMKLRVVYTPKMAVNHRANTSTGRRPIMKWFYIHRGKYRFAAKFFDQDHYGALRASSLPGDLTCFVRATLVLAIRWLEGGGKLPPAKRAWWHQCMGRLLAGWWVVSHSAELRRLRRATWRPDFQYNDLVIRLNAEREWVLKEAA